MKIKPLHALLQPPVFFLAIILMVSPSATKAQNGYYGTFFTTSFVAADTINGYAYINDASCNGNPAVQLQVTPNWDPNEIYNNFPFGVWYDNIDTPVSEFNRASIYDEANSGIPIGSTWNCLTPSTHGVSFVQISTSQNIEGAATFIDNLALNGKPTANVFVTHVWNPDTAKSYEIEDTEALGAYYDSSAAQWTVFNETDDAFAINLAFNIFVPDSTANVFQQVADVNNISNNVTFIDNPATNNNPNAVLIVTQLWSKNGVQAGLFNPHFLGVYYYNSKWAIFNEDGDNMPEGATYDVLVAGNTSGINQVAANNAPFKIYPNPAGTNVNLQMPKALSSNTQIDVFNILGQNVLEIPQSSNSIITIDVSNWPQGSYFVRAINGAGSYTNTFAVTRH